jgi:hypothetical protein
MNKTVNVDFIVPSMDENNVLDQLDTSYVKISEIKPDQRAFLNTLTLRNKSKKLLELGVSAGGSSILKSKRELFPVGLALNFMDKIIFLVFWRIDGIVLFHQT